MQQVVDLRESNEFQALGIEVLSLSPDPSDAWREEAAEFGITTPVLSDADNAVANRYGVMRWAVGDEPGHTFVLVDEDGIVRWIRDYGQPENGGLMYVPPKMLIEDMPTLAG